MTFVQLNKCNRSTTKLNIKNNVPYISFKALDVIPWLNNGFSTRIGGVSTGYLSSLNLGWAATKLEKGQKETTENVIKNHEIFAKILGVNPRSIVCSKQTHTTNIRVITKADCGKGIYKERDYEDVDGMITDENGIVLATYFADCVPLYIVDKENKAIGMVHSGWKGTVGKIGLVAIKKMQEVYNTSPKNIIACIGPSICQDCYEISEDVADNFKTAFPDNISDIIIDKGNGKYQLDLWKANQLVFKEAGVLPENIFMTDICTCCNTDVLFSHRGHNGKRGNLAAFLSITE